MPTEASASFRKRRICWRSEWFRGFFGRKGMRNFRLAKWLWHVESARRPSGAGRWRFGKINIGRAVHFFPTGSKILLRELRLLGLRMEAMVFTGKSPNRLINGDGAMRLLRQS